MPFDDNRVSKRRECARRLISGELRRSRDAWDTGRFAPPSRSSCWEFCKITKPLCLLNSRPDLFAKIQSMYVCCVCQIIICVAIFSGRTNVQSRRGGGSARAFESAARLRRGDTGPPHNETSEIRVAKPPFGITAGFAPVPRYSTELDHSFVPCLIVYKEPPLCH